MARSVDCISCVYIPYTYSDYPLYNVHGVHHTTSTAQYILPFTIQFSRFVYLFEFRMDIVAICPFLSHLTTNCAVYRTDELRMMIEVLLEENFVNKSLFIACHLLLSYTRNRCAMTKIDGNMNRLYFEE